MAKSNNDMQLSLIVLIAITCLLIYNFVYPFISSKNVDITTSQKNRPQMTKLMLTDKQWKERLTPLQYQVMREGATEPAFSGKYYDSKEKGTYICAACSLPLFSSEDKFDSKTGWPCFTKPINENNVWYKKNAWLFWSNNIEVLCSRCDSTLGHIFNDGPPPANKRYCINSIALNFVPATVEMHAPAPQIAPPSTMLIPQEAKGS